MATQLTKRNVKVSKDAIPFLNAHKMFGNKMLTNRELDRVIVETDIWQSVKSGLPTHSRTILGYDKPDKEIGSTIEAKDEGDGRIWTLPVPKELRKLKDIALVIEDYELEVDGKRVVIFPKDKITIVENFPAKDGYYQADPTFRIPTNVLLSESDQNARHLYRIDKRVGPIARGFDYDHLDAYGRGVYAGDDLPSDCLTVLTLDEINEQIKEATGQ